MQHHGGNYTVSLIENALLLSTNALFKITEPTQPIVRPTTIGELEDLPEQSIQQYGLKGDFNYIKTDAMTSMRGVFAKRFKNGKSADGAILKEFTADFNGDISE